MQIIKYDNTKITPIIGNNYTAMGTCGMTDGLEVKGELTEVKGYDVILKCKRNIPHLCNGRTLTEVKD